MPPSPRQPPRSRILSATDVDDAPSTGANPAPERPWATPFGDVASALDVVVEDGLSASEAADRLERFGPNEVAQQEGRSKWDIVVAQFLSPIVGILVAAGVAAALAGEVVEAIAVVIAVVINAIIGYVTEVRAMSSVESLRELGRTQAVVRRDGTLDTVDGADVVPGDVVVLEEGDVVPADLRLVDEANLQVDEAPLTGESEPVDKQVDPVADDAPLAERPSMAFKGTRVTVGSGTGVVVATGSATQVGEVSRLVEDADDGGQTPLEEQLDDLGKALIVAVVGVAVVVAGAGIAVGQDVQEMIETAIALAVAAVPEGLPLVATLALARGVVRMSRRNALVKRLASVETLGSASVVFTDKTGTLTEGRMRARRLVVLADGDVQPLGIGPDDPLGEDDQHADVAAAALLVGSLCGNAELRVDADGDGDADRDHDDEELEDDDVGGVGDPMEVALQQAARDAGIGARAKLLGPLPERREEAFDRSTKMMATIHALPDDRDGLDEALRRSLPEGDGLLVAVKGAPEAVLAACSRDLDGPLDDARREAWVEAEERIAGEGLRLLGLARKVVGGDGGVDDTAVDDIEVYDDLELVAMVGLLDPPRQATKEAVAACHRAGVEVIMVTGDQPATARAIAREVGIVDADDTSEVLRGSDIPPEEEWDDALRDDLASTRVFARLAPAQKLDLIDLAQDRGNVVGMTGDGVNDAPALTSADIGIAMGRRGTQVARDSADIILQDDAFETIVDAIREGRNIFANIRRFVVYLLSGNLGEIIAVTLAAVIGAPIPLLPLQILYINLVSDVFPASALGLVKGDDTVLADPPREPGTPIMGRQRWTETVLWALLVAAMTLGVFALALGPLDLEEDVAVTISFMAFAVARLLHVFNMRSPRNGVLDNPIMRSKVVWAALATSFSLLLLGVYLPPLADVLGVVTPDAQTWGLAVASGVAVWAVGQVALSIWGRRLRAREEG